MCVSSLAENMGKREHSTWDIMANAKPEEGEVEHMTPTLVLNQKMTNLSTRSIHTNVGGIWTTCSGDKASQANWPRAQKTGIGK